MKLVRIFVNEETCEGLYAVRYQSELLDEYERLFDLWADTQQIMQYCVANEGYLKAEHFDGQSIDQTVTKVHDEAAELEYLLEDFSEKGFKGGDNLQMLFRPLLNKQYKLPEHQETKAKVQGKRSFPKPILRLYGIRLGENTIVITGGAIKLTKTMDEHPDTVKEVEKLVEVKAFLKKNGLDNDEDLNDYYYEKF